MRGRKHAAWAAWLFAAIVAITGTANANIVTFDSLSGPNGTTFTSITEDGITVTSDSGLWQHAFLVGNPIPSIFSFSQVASIEVTMAGLFNFLSFDLGTGGASNPSFQYQGFLDNVLVLSGSGTPGGNTFATILSSNASVLLDRLVITTTLTSTSANIDNIVVNPALRVSEPGGLALLALGLVALRLARRRPT